MVPGFWLRRWTRFPRYYESHNPSMLLRMQRVPPDDDYQGWAERESRFLMETAHNIQADESFTMPTLASGEKDSMLIRGLYCPQPGSVVLTLAFIEPDGSRTRYPILSYQVEPESGPWLWGAWVLSLALTVAVTLGVSRLVGLL